MGAVKHVLAVDLETFSATDIAKCGSYKYMEDPEFEILLMAYAYDDADVVVLDFTAGDPIPAQVLKDLTDPGVTKTAFNCAFEREALRQHLGRHTASRPLGLREATEERRQPRALRLRRRLHLGCSLPEVGLRRKQVNRFNHSHY